MLESLFDKVADLKICSMIKKRLQHRYFSVNIEKYLRTTSLYNNSSGCFLLFIVNICYFKFQTNKRVLLIEMIKSNLIHEYQHKSTLVNTNQHEFCTNQHESDTSQHESDTSQDESTRVRHVSTRINTSLKKYHIPQKIQ